MLTSQGQLDESMCLSVVRRSLTISEIQLSCLMSGVICRISLVTAFFLTHLLLFIGEIDIEFRKTSAGKFVFDQATMDRVGRLAYFRLSVDLSMYIYPS